MSVYLQPKNPIGDLKRLEFPYTPQIDYSNDVKYDAYNTTHTNYQMYGYSRTENPQINMNCKFSAHTSDHFKSSLFAIRFLRTYTKMNYGRADELRGIPPRILRFFALGEQMFNDVPVVISKFSMTLPEDVDYVSLNSNGSSLTKGSSSRDVATPTNAAMAAPGTDSIVYLPVVFQVSISLLVQMNLYKAVTEFKLDDFASGKLGKQGYI